MKINNPYELAILLRSKLKAAKWTFNKYGFPIFPREALLDDCPPNVEPIQRINCCKHPQNTLLCSFANDKFIVCRLKRIFDELDLYSKFAGFGGFDLSPRIRWSFHRQKFNIWLSQLATAFICLNGQKILPNFRTGDFSTLFTLESYPQNSTYIVGTLGCSKRYNPLHAYLFKTKLLLTRPSQLIIYGPLRKEYKKILEDLAIPYNIRDDFRKNSFEETAKRRTA